MNVPALYDVCEADSPELKQLKAACQRASYRRENLANYTTHVDPAGFDTAMDQLEAAQAELRRLALEIMRLEAAEWDRLHVKAVQ